MVKKEAGSEMKVMREAAAARPGVEGRIKASEAIWQPTWAHEKRLITRQQALQRARPWRRPRSQQPLQSSLIPGAAHICHGTRAPVPQSGQMDPKAPPAAPTARAGEEARSQVCAIVPPAR
jgi:hypothetical protein